MRDARPGMFEYELQADAEFVFKKYRAQGAAYFALMTSIKVHVAPSSIIKEAVVKMDAVMANFKFTDPKIKEAATRFVERYRASTSNSLGHTIGMEVHDVKLPTQTLDPGRS